MSRRKAFDTSLSGAKGKAPQNQPQISAASSASHDHDHDHDHAYHNKHIHAPVAQSVVKAGKTIATPPELEGDSDVCFICAEPVTYWAVGTCNHHTCQYVHLALGRGRANFIADSQCLLHSSSRLLQVSSALATPTDSRMIECAYCKTLCPSLLFSREQAAFPEGPLRKPSTEARIERAQAEAEKPENKGKKWYQGLVLPGTLDLKEFEFKDEKLGVAFEDEEVVSSAQTAELTARWSSHSCYSASTARTPTARTCQTGGRRSRSTRSRNMGSCSAGCVPDSCHASRTSRCCTRLTCSPYTTPHACIEGRNLPVLGRIKKEISSNHGTLLILFAR